MIILPSNRLDGVATYYFARKMAEIAALNQDGKAPIINLGIGSPDLLPPANVIHTLNHSLLNVDAHKYQSYKGLNGYRQAISSWYERFFDVRLDPENEILPLMGSKEGIMHISMAFLNVGDQVLVPDPGYPAYSMCAKLAGAEPIMMPLLACNDWKPDLKKLDEMDHSRVKLMWINYPNMPTGAKADLEFFNELVSFAAKHRILICHDNPYALILNNQPLSIFNAEGSKECALELTSLSKCYNMAGWRVGAVVGAKPYIDTILTFKSNMDSGMFRPIQEAAITALNTSDQWLDDLNNEYLVRKKSALALMHDLGLVSDPNGAGLFVWGKINDESISGQQLSDVLLHQSRVFITPGYIFGSQGHQHMRISLCSPVDEIEAARYRIRTGFNNQISSL